MYCLTFWQYFYLPTLSGKHLGTTTCSLLAGSRVGEVGTRLKIPFTHRFNRRLPMASVVCICRLHPLSIREVFLLPHTPRDRKARLSPTRGDVTPKKHVPGTRRCRPESVPIQFERFIFAAT